MKNADEIKKGLDMYTPEEVKAILQQKWTIHSQEKLYRSALALINRLDKTIVDQEKFTAKIYDQKVEAEEKIQRLEAQNAALSENIMWMEAERDDLKRTIQQLEAERDAAIHDMHEAQSIVCLICKNYYQPDPAVKKYGCKEFGEHWLEDGGAIVCGKFEWRGVQKEDT